jgi:hypothetical protein
MAASGDSATRAHLTLFDGEAELAYRLGALIAVGVWVPRSVIRWTVFTAHEVVVRGPILGAVHLVVAEAWDECTVVHFSPWSCAREATLGSAGPWQPAGDRGS